MKQVKKYTRKNIKKRRKKTRYRRKKTRYRRKKTRYRKRRKKTTRKSSYGGNRWKPNEKTNVEELKSYLTTNGITIETINEWENNPCNKSLEKLLQEINAGDCVLEIRKNPVNNKMMATRIVHVARAIIFYDEHKTYQLKEVEQIKTDTSGNISCRPRPGPSGDGVILSEKMKSTEIDGGNNGIRAAIYRGLKEELGKIYADNFKGPEGKYTLWQSDIEKLPAEHQDSNSYSGLPAIYYYYTVEGIIPELTQAHRDKKKKFYINDEADGKSIGWRWTPVTK